MGNVFAVLKNWFLEHKRDALIFALIFLVSSISFALGFLMARETGRAPIVIERNAE